MGISLITRIIKYICMYFDAILLASVRSLFASPFFLEGLGELARAMHIFQTFFPIPSESLDLTAVSRAQFSDLFDEHPEPTSRAFRKDVPSPRRNLTLIARPASPGNQALIALISSFLDGFSTASRKKVLPLGK